MFLQVRLCALTARTDRHSVVFERSAGRRELVQVRSRVIMPNNQEADTVWPAAVFLRIHLRLCKC